MFPTLIEKLRHQEDLTTAEAAAAMAAIMKGEAAQAQIAGLLVGVVVSMTSLFAPEMAKVSIFALMALVLLVRPQGFFGRAGLMS